MMSVTLVDGSNSIVLPDPQLSNVDDLTLKTFFHKSRIGHIRTTRLTSVKRVLTMSFILTYSLMNNLAWILNETRKVDSDRLYSMTDHNGNSWQVEIINNPLSDSTISNADTSVTLIMQGYEV